MRAILSTSLLVIVAALSVSACSSSSNASNNAADQTAVNSAADNSAANTASDNTAASSDNAAPSDNSASSDNSAAATDSSAATVTVAPVYPGSAAGTRPKGVADGAPPSAKAYSTTDDYVKVRTWYQTNMKGVPELGATDKTKDVFLLGKGKTASVLMIQSASGKTWIITGPATP